MSHLCTLSSHMELSSSEEKTLHWNGILAVIHGQFPNLAEAKDALRRRLLLEKSGVAPALLDTVSADEKLTDFYLAILSGAQWGDIWYDSTLAELTATKKSLRQIYVDLALEPAGRWRLGAEKIRLEERLTELQKELGCS